MKLDDLARRAADEVREASREARFTVRPPGNRRWRLPVAAVATAVVVLAVGVPLLFLNGPWANRVTEVSVATTTAATTTTEAATTTTEAATTTAAVTKTPAATVEELVTAVYAAVNAKDSDAVWALHTDDAFHPIYYVAGRTGTISDNITPGYDWSSDPMQRVEALGESLVSGDVVVTPLRATYPDPTGVLTGFDVTVVRHVEGGLLVGGAATFFADDRPDLVADPADAEALIEASAAAFNVGDVEGVLGTMTGSSVLWEDMTDVDTTHLGTSRLREFLTANLGFTVEYTGEPLFSGPFVAVPSRHTVEATGLTYDGMYIFWIRDGKIALQAYAQGG